MKRTFDNRIRTMASMKYSKIGKFAVLFLTLIAMSFSMIAVPGVEAGDLEARKNAWGHRDAKQPKRKCGDNRITGFSKDLEYSSSGGGAIVHVKGDYRYKKLRNNGSRYIYKMEAKVRVIGGPNDTNGRYVWTDYGNYDCKAQGQEVCLDATDRNITTPYTLNAGVAGTYRITNALGGNLMLCMHTGSGKVYSKGFTHIAQSGSGTGWFYRPGAPRVLSSYPGGAVDDTVVYEREVTFTPFGVEVVKLGPIDIIYRIEGSVRSYNATQACFDIRLVTREAGGVSVTRVNDIRCTS